MSAGAPDGFYREFGRLVRLHRERAAGMTQEALGRLIGLSRASVVNIEKGRQHVALHQLYAIADALGVQPDVLLPAADTTQAAWVAEKLPPDMDASIREWAGKIIREK